METRENRLPTTPHFPRGTTQSTLDGRDGNVSSTLGMSGEHRRYEFEKNAMLPQLETQDRLQVLLRSRERGGVDCHDLVLGVVEAVTMGGVQSGEVGGTIRCSTKHSKMQHRIRAHVTVNTHTSSALSRFVVCYCYQQIDGRLCFAFFIFSDLADFSSRRSSFLISEILSFSLHVLFLAFE